MKKLFFGLLLSMVLINGCSKVDNGCTNATVDSERAAMVAFANANNMANATTHASGIMYVIDQAGQNASIDNSRQVYARYKGALLSGAIFDGATTSFAMSRVISGWQIGIPLIKKGGKIRFIIPSSLGYGCFGSPANQNYNVAIPSNSPLYFEVEVLDVL